MTRLEEIDKEIEEINLIIWLKEKVWDDSKSWDEYREYLNPENKRILELGREKRMLMPYKLSELSKFGEVMSLNHFIGCVKSGLFIDYDGHGRYCKDGMVSNIEIFPSDVENDSIRKEFDSIVWYNR